MNTSDNDRSITRLHWISVALCILTFGLIVWGGHVNTTRSGMAFPDWPTSNAAPMLTYAPSEWLTVPDRFWEHGHRLFASVVGLITVLVLLVSYRAIPRERRAGRTIMALDGFIFLVVATALVGINSMPGGFMEAVMTLLAVCLAAFLVRASREKDAVRVHWLAQAAFVGVCLQACFGGYTVRNNLPDWTSTTHGMLAEIYFMIVIGIALLTSKAWRNQQRGGRVATAGRATTIVVCATWALTFVQFFLGALTRHTDAWGVSTSFPQWSDEGFFPSSELLQYAQVVIHLTHRTTAYVVALLVVIQWIMIWRRRSDFRRVALTSTAAMVLVFVQILLGAAILWTARGELATTLHVMTGVVLLALNTITMYTMLRFHVAPSSRADVLHSVAVGQGSR